MEGSSMQALDDKIDAIFSVTPEVHTWQWLLRLNLRQDCHQCQPGLLRNSEHQQAMSQSVLQAVQRMLESAPVEGDQGLFSYSSQQVQQVADKILQDMENSSQVTSRSLCQILWLALVTSENDKSQ